MKTSNRKWDDESQVVNSQPSHLIRNKKMSDFTFDHLFTHGIKFLYFS